MTFSRNTNIIIYNSFVTHYIYITLIHVIKTYFCRSVCTTINSLGISRNIREFKLPLLNFKATTYYELVQIKFRKTKGPGNPPKEPIFPVYTVGKKKGSVVWESVKRPPIFKNLNYDDIAGFVVTPFLSDIENHTQTVEHGVATTSKSVKRRRTEKSQLMCALSTIDAREKLPGRITHKRFKNIAP